MILILICLKYTLLWGLLQWAIRFVVDVVQSVHKDTQPEKQIGDAQSSFTLLYLSVDGDIKTSTQFRLLLHTTVIYYSFLLVIDVLGKGYVFPRTPPERHLETFLLNLRKEKPLLLVAFQLQQLGNQLRTQSF